MAAMLVTLDETVSTPVEGISAFLLIVPITLLAAVTLVGMAVSALHAMTEEELTDGYGPIGRRGGAHAETPWQLRTPPLTAPAPAHTSPRPGAYLSLNPGSRRRPGS